MFAYLFSHVVSGELGKTSQRGWVLSCFRSQVLLLGRMKCCVTIWDYFTSLWVHTALHTLNPVVELGWFFHEHSMISKSPWLLWEWFRTSAAFGNPVSRYGHETSPTDHFGSSLTAWLRFQVQTDSTSPLAHGHTSHLQPWDPLLMPPRDPTLGSCPLKSNLEVWGSQCPKWGTFDPQRVGDIGYISPLVSTLWGTIRRTYIECEVL